MAILWEKWGEWTVIGHDGSAFEVAFINIGAALFSGLMKTYLVLTYCILLNSNNSWQSSIP